MTPAELLVGQTWAFVVSRLAGAKRILEVGCGDGALARHLADGGAAVTAVDIALPEHDPHPGVTFVHSDFLVFEEKPFDAVLFTSSLHHVSPLEAAVDRAWRLLVPGGKLLIEELAVEAPDETTAAWYYGMQALLGGQGVLHAAHPAHAGHDAGHDAGHSGHTGGAPGAAPPAAGTARTRWDDEHRHEPPLHHGEAMRREIGRRFPGVRIGTGPYLYRQIAARLPATDGAGKLALKLFEREKEGIASGRLTPVGLRFDASRSEAR